MEKKKKVIQTLVRRFFKNSKGQPYDMSSGEAEIFLAIIDPFYKWLWVSAPTRYGKTETVAMALLYLAVFHNLKLPIVAGSEDKAQKIMAYIVQHIGDHYELFKGLIVEDISDIEKLKVTMAKNALRWATGGWIFVTSIDSRSISREGEGVVGEGGDVIVLEEAGLIKREEQFSKVVRMAEEGRGWGKLVMIGNCVENSVFEKAFNNPIYKKLRITLEQAVAEGRFSWKALEEKKKQTTSKDWKRYYLVEFPAANEFTYFKPQKYELLPRDLKFYGACDPALGESKKGSLIGIIVLGLDEKGQRYEVFSFGQQIKPEQTMNEIFNLPYKFERFGVEAIQFQRYFLNQMDAKSKAEKRYIPFVAIEQKRAKEERIESMEPAINTGQILFRGDGILWDHMQDYPELDQLDVLDTLEMADRLITGEKVDFEIV